ncbi:MAG: HAMP domain-containing sensor histidine kinase [Acidimicrobiales bacterium]
MSLRLRLLVAVGLIAIVALVVADFATYSALRSSLYQQVDQELAQQPHRLPGTNGFPCPSPSSRFDDQGNSGAGPGAGSGDGGNDFPNVSGYNYIAVVRSSGAVLVGSECPAYVGDHAYRPSLPNTITGFTTQPDGEQVAYFTTGSIDPDGPSFRVRAERVDVITPSGSQTQAVLVQAQPLTDQNSTLHTLFLTELAVTAGALVLALAGGWWLVRLGLRPLEDVERTADSIAAGDLDQRVPGADQATEVGRLARALNVMLERIQAAFSARVASESRLRENEQHLRQFVADASHELRTPIAAVSAYAELFERGGSERPEDLPRIVSGIRTETARMDRLVSDLLELARLDEGVPMETGPVELVSLASDAVRTATAVGPEWPVQFSATRPVEVAGDKDRLRQVLDNLLANVRAHTPPGTTATVHVDQIGDQAKIEVRDTGPGMAEEDARRVFERFYRADTARTRTRGGSGLGLSIVAAIVSAHRGTVSAASSPGNGLVITVLLPVSTVPAGPEPSGSTDQAPEPVASPPPAQPARAPQTPRPTVQAQEAQEAQAPEAPRPSS